MPKKGITGHDGWVITEAKETKFFRKQAAKAERMARSASDAEMFERFTNMAKAYRVVRRTC